MEFKMVLYNELVRKKSSKPKFAYKNLHNIKPTGSLPNTRWASPLFWEFYVIGLACDFFISQKAGQARFRKGMPCSLRSQ